MVIPSPTAVTINGLLLAAMIVPTVAVAALQLAARRRGARVSRWRVLALVGGALLLAVAFVSPLATVGAHYLLAAHMLQVIVVMGFVPPLLLLGLPEPARRTRSAPRVLRAIGGFLVHPVTAILLVNGAFFAWHITPVYNVSAGNDQLYALQLASLLAVSVLFWWPIVQPTGRRARMSSLVKLGYILLATIPQTFFGLVFALAHHTFYTAYSLAPRLFGLSLLTDQEVSGALMALVSKLALFAAFSVVFWRLMSREDADYNSGDDGGRGHDDDAPTPVPSGAPAWLGLLEAGYTVDEPDLLPRRTLPTTPAV